MTLGRPLIFFIFGVALTVLTSNGFALERRSTDQIQVDWALAKEIDGVIKRYFNFEKPTVFHYVYNVCTLHPSP